MDGEIKIVITPQLKLDIFEEYPVVKKAFEENVDKKVWRKERARIRRTDVPRSCPSPSSGIVISSQSFSTRTVLLFVRLQHST